jgi:hypothetical protein
MKDLKLKKETIDMPIEVEHYGWFCDDKDFGNKYEPYKDWIELKYGVEWDDYYSGTFDHDTELMDKFCKTYNIDVDCHYDESSKGIYLIKRETKNG